MCTKVCFAARAASCKRCLILLAQTLLLRNACVLGSGPRENSRDILRPQIRKSGRYIIMPQYTDPEKRCHGDLVPPCVLVPRVPNHRRYGTPWSTISPSVTCLHGDMVPPREMVPCTLLKLFFFKCPSKKHTHARIHVWFFCTLAQLYIYTKLRQWQGVRVFSFCSISYLCEQQNP